MTALARRPLAELIRPARRRLPAPPVRREPRAHFTVLAAPATTTHELAAEARSPIVRPPCPRLGGHFPTPTAPCFYGCEVP